MLKNGIVLSMSGDPLIMGYFDNFDDKLLNKYKKKKYKCLFLPLN
jgi:hypothetical protein